LQGLRTNAFVRADFSGHCGFSIEGSGELAGSRTSVRMEFAF
jgi:hypothetical protein